MELADRVRRAKRVYIIGNGGSHANAQHIANDLQACGIRAHTIDAATLTALANDYSYAYAYARWLNVHAEAGDFLMALSGSGKSPNILNACEAAEKIGMDVFKLFGAEMGHNMQQAEEFQVRLGHNLRAELCG